MEKKEENIFEENLFEENLFEENKIPLLGFIFDAQDLNQVKEKVENFLSKTKHNIFKVKLKNIGNVELLIKNGFLPSFLDPEDNSYSLYGNNSDLTRKFSSIYVEKMSNDDFMFWYDDTIQSLLEDLRYTDDLDPYKIYLYGNIQGWKDFCLKNAVSLPLYFYSPNLLYNSFRPKTEMLMFKDVNSQVYKNVQDDPENINGKILLTEENKIIKGIPVTRYSKGMSKGLYYKESDKKYCGTFYYFEPESTTFLKYNTYRTYRNKYNAIYSLYEEFNIKDNVKSPFMKKSKSLDDSIIQNYYINPYQFPKGLLMSPKQYMNITKNYYKKSINVNNLTARKHYVGVNLGLYALEDIYDQEICNIAAKNNIDIIILREMIGEYQVVSEILDTRSRNISFKNLIYTNK